MRTLSFLRATVLAVSLLGVSTIPAFAQDQFAPEGENLGASVGAIPVPAGLSKDDVRNAVAAAFVARGWTVQGQTDQSVVGHIKRHRYEAILTVVISPQQLDLFCLGYIVNRAGERIRPEVPIRWVNNIKQDFTKTLTLRATMVH